MRPAQQPSVDHGPAECGHSRTEQGGNCGLVTVGNAEYSSAVEGANAFWPCRRVSQATAAGATVMVLILCVKRGESAFYLEEKGPSPGILTGPLPDAG